MSPPIISPYKKWFAVKRIIQTFLGGPKLVSSFSIIIFQVFIYLVPAVIICVVNVVDSNIIRWEWKALLTGMGMLLTDVTLTFLIWILKQRRDVNITPEQGDRNPTSLSVSEENVGGTLFDEEEAVPNDGCFKSSTWRFIALNVNMSLCHFSALLVSAISIFFSVSVLADNSVHPVLKAFVIFTLCNARYSSVINSAPEVATFDPVNRRHLFYRPFYVSFCASINFAIILFKDIKRDASGEIVSAEPDPCNSTICGIILAVLPLIWLSGIIPPLDALFPWLFETVLELFGGKSVGYSYFGTTISLALAMVGPLATFILSQKPNVTFLLECLCGYLISCDTGSMPKLKASLCEDIPAKYFLQQLIKPAVTILCSLLGILVVETTLSHSSNIPDRDIFHPVLAGVSVFILLSTKMVQMLDIVDRKWASSRLYLSIFTMWHGLLTIVLHVWITLELVTEHLESSFKKSLELVVHSLQQLIPCILTIRFYALAVTEPHNSTINIIITYLIRFVVFTSEDIPMKFVILLFIVSMSHTILKRFLQYLRMVVIFTHSTFSSNLLDKKYVAVATLISAPVSICSVLMTSIVKGMTLVPMFTLPVFTIGFPRPHSFWKGIWLNRSCGQNETQKILPLASSVDWTIYADAAPFLVLAFAKRSEESKSDLEPGSCYIARYDDRLLFIRILSYGWKFLYAQVKGLEIQEQTSCHHQEAAWIDEMFEKYLHSRKCFFRRLYTQPMSIFNSLEPKFCLSVPSYSESKSQLPSFLSKKGKHVFRDMFFRAFSYLWIKGNPAFQGESYRRPIASGVPLGKSLYSRIHHHHHQGPLFERSQSSLKNGHYASNPINEDRNNIQLGLVGPGPDLNGNRSQSLIKGSPSTEVMSSAGSVRGTSAPMMLHRQHPPLRDVSAANWPGSVSYPLIPGLPNLAIEDSEFESLQNSLNQCTNENSDTQEITSVAISPPSVLMRKSGISWDGLPQLWMKQCAGEAIPFHNALKARVEKLCWKAWEVAFGTFDDLFEVDIARFYRREFAKNMKTAMVHEKSEFEEIAVRAFRYATKLTLDELYASGMDLDEPIPQACRSATSGCDNETVETSVIRSEEDEQGIFHKLTTFEKAFIFCPYDEVPYWMNEKTKHIVSICADGEQNILRIFNYQSEGVEFSVGELSKCCVEGIWSSLNTELLYLTSDDDERYSIQHDKYQLRNICAQSAQTLGYPVYEATFHVNLFDFSVEQVSI
ncbi:unnamed protein product [Orchesella dallaii]|uniref:Pecanex-like protein n=1 Tax=Orchesella dallaii TaxID=48710 RepID=A0ABP1PYK6_9HEXA